MRAQERERERERGCSLELSDRLVISCKTVQQQQHDTQLFKLSAKSGDEAHES